MRTVEPLDDAFEPERPTLLSAVLNMLIENGVQTKAQIVDALKLNHSDIEQLCGASPCFLDHKVIPELKPRVAMWTFYLTLSKKDTTYTRTLQTWGANRVRRTHQCLPRSTH